MNKLQSSALLSPGSHIQLPRRFLHWMSTWQQERVATKNINLTVKLLGSKSWLCHLCSLWSWELYLISLCLSYLMCKMGILLPIHRVLRELIESLDINYVEQHLLHCKWYISVSGYCKVQNGTIGLPIPNPLPSQSFSL